MTNGVVSMLFSPMKLLDSAVMQDSEVSWFRVSMFLAMLGYCEMSGVTVGFGSHKV